MVRTIFNLQTMEITIQNRDYKLKYTLRALFIYEQVTGKVFEMKTITDEYLFFYCLLAANNPDIPLTFDELIDELDEDPKLMVAYKEFMVKEIQKQAMFITPESGDKKKL